MNLNDVYRPKSFLDIIGQDDIKKIINASLKKKRFPNQILFTGTSGVGKTTLARVIAQSLLCNIDINKRENSDPCQSCQSCVKFLEGIHPDYIEVDAASHGGKDEINILGSKTNLSALLSDKRVFVIDEAHAITSAGGNAFLKILEEPGESVYFILCTTDPEKMLETNRSRCIEFNLQYPTGEDIALYIVNLLKKENLNIDLITAKLIAEEHDKKLGVRGLVNVLSSIIAISENNVSLSDIEVVLNINKKRKVKELVNNLLMGKCDYNDIINLSENFEKKVLKNIFLESLSEKIKSEDDKLVLLNLYKESIDKNFDIFWLSYIYYFFKQRCSDN